jgi:hypothetical protein
MKTREDIVDSKACLAFHITLQRNGESDFLKNEILVYDKKKIGNPVICQIEARKKEGNLSRATGVVYVYPDLVIVCLESLQRERYGKIDYPNNYQYFGC